MRIAILVRCSTVLIALIILGLACEQCSRKSSDQHQGATIPDSLKRYPFRSAVIELRYSGSATGRQTIYIDDFGQKETTIDSLSMKMMDMELPNYKVQIKKGDSLYQIDYIRGMATKEMNHISAKDEQDIAATGEAVAGGMGMKKDSAEEVVAGQRCAVWISEQMGTKSWMWNNLVLRSESKIGDDTIHLEAVSVSVDVPVPAERFEPPGNVRYTTMEEIQGMLDKIDRESGTKMQGGQGTKRRKTTK